MTEIPISNRINVTDLWRGIGGHFDSLSQIFHELIDNSISNFRNNKNLNHRNIYIKFDTAELSLGYIKVTIEDTGTGIRDINSAFTIGDKSAQETPMNEHGFGLKHALASANPENDNWAVYTRTQENVEANNFICITSDYKIDDYKAVSKKIETDEYPSLIDNKDTGTIVSFRTSREMFNTIGRYGTQDVKKLIYYLKENLGYTYSGILSKGIANIDILLNREDRIRVEPVTPWWKKTIQPGESITRVDLGEIGNGIKTGEVDIHYHFGVIDKREPINNEDVVLYYNTTMKNSGVEVRLNGRSIKNNILNEIWDVQQHNQYNDFLVIIDLISENKNALPATRSSKNGFREGDSRLLGLYKWIKKNCPEPYKNKTQREGYDLFNELMILKQKQLEDVVSPPLLVLTEYRLLKSFKESIRIDLYVSYDNNIIIYHGTKNVTSIRDIYEMRMLWDACILEGIQPTNAIILGVDHTPGVFEFMRYTNNLLDGNGNRYKFNLKTWRDEGINFPSND